VEVFRCVQVYIISSFVGTVGEQLREIYSPSNTERDLEAVMVKSIDSSKRYRIH
jgi:hypothetical protein